VCLANGLTSQHFRQQPKQVYQLQGLFKAQAGFKPTGKCNRLDHRAVKTTHVPQVGHKEMGGTGGPPEEMTREEGKS
jgi:hypothetical protein